MDNDLISRSALLAAYDAAHKGPPGGARRLIEEAPAIDAAPVVRCLDCKNWDSSTEGRYVGGWCFCEKLQFSTSPNWFCADGERASTCGPDYCDIGGGDDADG